VDVAGRHFAVVVGGGHQLLAAFPLSSPAIAMSESAPARRPRLV
jgi:hypothetical protein